MSAEDWRANAENSGKLAADAMRDGYENLSYYAAKIAAHYGRLYLGRPVMTFNEFLSYAASSCINGRSK